MSATPKHTNRLAGETSPYLLQHAHNPVDWYPWGVEALARAKREDKPILLSIGYAACHWCHVMERESFENEAIAGLMNQDFVCIKVDREERPDLDDIYMAATIAMSGGGGWPMTVFLTPDQQPIFAGTYFPPTDKYGRPGFPTLLEHIAGLWKSDRDGLLRQAAELTEHVREQSGAARPAPVEANAIEQALRQLARGFDERWGGFSPAPKFPPSATLSLLLRHHRHAPDAQTLKMVTVTLDAMKNGGMYDHIGGGFARYSTDERWLVPHFEKMLYDNAQLARVYLEAFQVTGDAEYRRVAIETLDYVIREMEAPDGGYYSATDADSEGEEGKFFVWQPDEIEQILGATDAARFCDYYDITPGGNWEGASIANTPQPDPAIAKSLEQAKQLVYTARKRRIPPLLDDKLLTSWNALMIGAMSEGARVLGEARYRESAERAARCVLERMRRPDRGLYRTARGDKVHLDAYLEDYAFLSDALVDLYECGGATAFLVEARQLAERMIADFGDPDGGAFFHTAHGHEQLLVRTREGHDGAIPSPNAVAARALARLSYHLDREDLREHARAAIRAYGRQIERQPRAFATALAVVDFLVEGPIELAFVGNVPALEREVARHYVPNRIVAHPESGSALPLPLLEGRTESALYVCRDFTCKAPITDPSQVASALGEGVAAAIRERAPTLANQQLEGSATPGGTAGFAARFGGRHGPWAYAPLGRTGLVASRLGFGCYRIDDGDPDHRAALAKALREGVNLVDTSTNYTEGRSERLVGEVIADLVRRRELAREEVIVVSKVGYVQRDNLEIAKHKDFPEMVKIENDLWHCMHPEWLADQLDRSLARLGLTTLDVCLVHNPEYFFDVGDGDRDEYYRRLEQAFAHFETEVARGRIRAYGVSSNAAASPAAHRKATSLVRLLDAARRVGGVDHHFHVLQLPANLLEGGAALEPNNEDQSVLACANQHGVAILVNRPLNAIVDGKLLRLAEPPELDRPPPFDSALAKVGELEQEFRRTLAAGIKVGEGSVPPASFFSWADQLRNLPAKLESLEQWRDIELHEIAPRVGHIFRVLDQVLKGELAERWRDWRGRYIRELDAVMAALRSRAADRSRARASAVSRAIDPLLPEVRRSAPLSQKALWCLCSTKGVGTVLVGMREPDYVDDALSMMGWEPLEAPERVFRAVRAAGV